MTPNPSRAQRTDFRRWISGILPTLAAAVLVLLLVDLVLSVAVLNQNTHIRQNQKKADETLQRQRAATLGGCQRLQLVRDDLNSINARVYKVIRLASAPALGTASTALLFAAVQKESPAVGKLLVKLTENGLKAKPLYDEILRGTVYLPPTDCDQAVDHPATWRAPKPVPMRLFIACYDPATNPRPREPCRTR
jgi:hypothetical protein